MYMCTYCHYAAGIQELHGVIPSHLGCSLQFLPVFKIKRQEVYVGAAVFHKDAPWLHYPMVEGLLVLKPKRG